MDTKNHLTIFEPKANVKLADYTYDKDKERVMAVLTKIFKVLIIVLVSFDNHNFNH